MVIIKLFLCGLILEKAILFSRNQVFWLKINFDELQLPYNSIFFAETSGRFPTYQCLQHGVRDFFLFFDLEVFAIIKKTWFLHSRFLHFYRQLKI